MHSREVYPELPSTQERALALARKGAPEGTRVVASRQTAGFGRDGRLWASPPGGLYVSVVLNDPATPKTLLPLLIGAELARALARRYHAPLRLKWPNDVVVAGPALGSPRKLAGILVDLVGSPDGPRAVAGIGVNLAPLDGVVPEAVAALASSLSEFVTPLPLREEVEQVAVEAALDARRALGTPTGPARARALCSEWLYGVGLPATDGASVRGWIEDLGPEGELLLATDDGTVAVRSGTVRMEAVG